MTEDTDRGWWGVVPGYTVRHYDSIGSTNDAASRWALADAPQRAVVLADVQTSGRGRHGRIWEAASGSALLMSVILRPVVVPEKLSLVTLLGAVALAEALQPYGVEPQIKWPNDVLIGGRKVAGILSEAVWVADELQAVVLGMGINVSDFALSPEAQAAYNATSLEAECDNPPERGALLADILEKIDAWLPRITDDQLLDRWRVFSAVLGQSVEVNTPSGVVQGIAEDVDESGALLLKLPSGEVQQILAGDVTLGSSGR